MQSLNIKEWKLLELQITQTWHPLSILDGKMSNFTTPQNEKKVENVHKIQVEGAPRRQYVNKLGTPKVLRMDGQMDGVDPLLDLLSLKRRR